MVHPHDAGASPALGVRGRRLPRKRGVREGGQRFAARGCAGRARQSPEPCRGQRWQSPEPSRGQRRQSPHPNNDNTTTHQRPPQPWGGPGGGVLGRLGAELVGGGWGRRVGPRGGDISPLQGSEFPHHPRPPPKPATSRNFILTYSTTLSPQQSRNLPHTYLLTQLHYTTYLPT